LEKNELSSIDKIFFKKKPAAADKKESEEIPNPFAQFAVKLEDDKR
jgi:hypothetical protein